MRNDAIHQMRRANGRRPGLPADGLHDGSRCGEPARSQGTRYASIARCAAYLCLPASAGPPSRCSKRIRPAASRRPVLGPGCRFRVQTRPPHLQVRGMAAVARPSPPQGVRSPTAIPDINWRSQPAVLGQSNEAHLRALYCCRARNVRLEQCESMTNRR